MQIIPMRDLKNTVEIERRCAAEDGPVLITKNGYGRLVVMDINYYERTMRKIDEAHFINQGIKSYEENNIIDGKTSLEKMRKKI